MSRFGRARRHLFGIPDARDVFARPGFTPLAWQRFQPVAVNLMEGYHAALEDPRPNRLAARLDAVDPTWAGIAYEGAGMGLAALNAITPGRDLVSLFGQGEAAAHLYPFYVGVGLAYARLHSAPESHLDTLDPLLGWVTADGYGFHEAFFRWRHTVDGRAVPARLSGYGRRMFDQGVGRAVWFASGADVDRVIRIVLSYPQSRHSDLWSGVGLASAYCGGADRADLRRVRDAAQPHLWQLARGAATAAWGRTKAGNRAPHTNLACTVYAGLDDQSAADVVQGAISALPLISAEPSHETWRLRIEDSLRQSAPALSTVPAGNVDKVPAATHRIDRRPAELS